jgi:aspartate aminotransferase-like enzyme
MTEHPVLFIPGPVEVEEELRQIMALPLIGHRDPVFVAEVKAICDKLRTLFHTDNGYALFENCPATALMEAAIRNLVPRDGRVLHLTGGAFSDRWAAISAACGRNVERLEVAWGVAHDPEALRQRLAVASPPFHAVAITHNETSTGVLEPLRQLAAVARETAPAAMLMVDVVTSLAGAEVRFEDWGLDVAFAGTQKCLALPPGLCVYAVSDRAMQRAATVEERGFLLDFLEAQKGLAQGRTLATPSVPLVFALSRQLDRIAEETLQRRWDRHRALRDETLRWAGEHDFEPFVAESGARSPTVTCLRASGHDVAELAAQAQRAGFKMDKGYGKLKGETFRIGHMGDHQPERLARFLHSLE